MFLENCFTFVMSRLEEEQDTVLLVMYTNGKISNYYIVSLEILRLFPLSYLNDLFPGGIPFGAFLTGHQVKDIYGFINTSNNTIVGNDSCTNLFEAEKEGRTDLKPVYDSDQSEINEFDMVFKYLFERVPSGASDIAMQKGVHVHADQQLFDYFGLYFQKVIAEEILSIRRNHFPSLSDGQPQEFMFLKEQIDIYGVLGSNTETAATERVVIGSGGMNQDVLVTACKEYLLDQTEVDWNLTGLETPLSILEFIHKETKSVAQWDIIKGLDDRKSVVKYTTIPIHGSRVEKQQSSDEIISSNLITQVSKTEAFSNVQDAIKARESFRHTHWQKIPVFQISKKNRKEDRIGTLWMRRSWSVEFSRTLSS
jgi:hypothetical protein